MKINNIFIPFIGIIFLWLTSSFVHGEDLLEDFSSSISDIQNEVSKPTIFRLRRCYCDR